MRDSSLCPCCSGRPYSLCCARFHEGEIPLFAEELMRSRYSAFAQGKTAYIIATTHPEHKDAQKNLARRTREIEEFSTTTLFKKLEILKVENGEVRSYVTFRVFLEQKGKPLSYTERSTFEKREGRWLYLLGDLQGEFQAT